MSDFGDETGATRSEAWYQQLVEQSQDITMVVDVDGAIHYTSSAVTQVLGYEPGAMNGDGLLAYTHPEDRDDLGNALDASLDDPDRSRTVEARFQTNKGAWSWIEAALQYYPGDDIDGVLVTARPVTERTEREDTLATMKERMELALEGANIGIWDWDMTTNEVQRDELLTEMLGYTPTEMGDHIRDWERLVHPDGKKRHDEALAEHVEDQTPYYQCEYRLKTDAGDWRWVRTIGKVVERDDTGSPVRAVGIHQDIDDRKRVELALQDERDIFREGPTVVFKWEDATGWPVTYVSENVESVFGYPPEKLQSSEFVFADLVHDADLDRVERAKAGYDDEGTELFNPDPYRVITADGTVRWVMEYTKSLHEEGEKTHLLGYLVDITERKEREQQLETYQLLFENTNDCIVRIESIEGEAIVRDVNEAFETTFGYDREQLVGESIDQFIVPEGLEAEADRLNQRVVDEDYLEAEVTRMTDDGPREFLMRSAYYEENAGYILYTDITERKEREQEIKAQNDRLQALFANAQSAIVEYVFEGDRPLVVDVNKRFEEHFGYDRDAIVGDVLDEHIMPPGEDYSGTDVNKEIKQREYQPREVERQTPEGIKTFILRNAPIDIDEKIRGYASYNDITERKERERELQEREEKYRSLFEDTRDALMLLDRDGFFDCNERTLELFGFDSVEDFVALTPWEISPETQPDGRDSEQLAKAQVERAFEEGEAFFEWVHERRDGTEFPAEVKLSKFQVDGEPVLHALVRDITARKEYEQAIEEARDELRQVIDLIPDPVFAKTRDGEYLLANEATADAYGTTIEAIEGSNEATVIPNVEDAEGFRQDDRKVIDSGEPTEVSEELTTASGDRRIYQTSRIPFNASDSAEPAVLGYARDVTELKEYEHEIEAQRDNLEVLNQVVRHDIRNDLQLVLAYAETLAEHVEDDGEEYVERILEAAREAVDITMTARDVTKILLESAVDPHPIHLGPVLEEQVNEARSSYDKGTITLEGPSPDVAVLADDMLESVFRNVLKNAFIHNDKSEPAVTVSAEAADDVVEVAIADNGPGIPDDRKAEIFEEGAQDLDSGGTGLGLYLVDTLVDRYDGDVRVEDNDPEGTVFVIELPVAE